MKFDCACTDDGLFRCHRDSTAWCHDLDIYGCPMCGEPADYCRNPREHGVCPPCWLARLRSVSLSSAATPTRGKA